MITEPKYVKNHLGDMSITPTKDGDVVHIPIDSGNTDYAELMKLVEEDKITIEEVTEE